MGRAQVDLVVIGPEQPLVDGVHDALRKVGIWCFGPSKRAAQMEGSKAYMKAFASRYGIPTASYQVRTGAGPYVHGYAMLTVGGDAAPRNWSRTAVQTFRNHDEAVAYVKSLPYRVVIKVGGGRT